MRRTPLLATAATTPAATRHARRPSSGQRRKPPAGSAARHARADAPTDENRRPGWGRRLSAAEGVALVDLALPDHEEGDDGERKNGDDDQLCGAHWASPLVRGGGLQEHDRRHGA